MYREHFGLRELPFSASPNSAFYVDLADHREASNLLLFCLRSGEGFTKIVGEVGTGKTLLCRMLLRRLGKEFVTAYLPNPNLPPIDMLLSLSLELGIPLPPRPSAHELLDYLRQELVAIRRSGKRSILLIDEAQCMSDGALEAIRLLSNLELESSKLLQIVLFAQPELDWRLARPALRQLQQRIGFSHRLGPMDRNAFDGYVRRRLMTAGYSGGRLFTPFAATAIYRASRGIPRLVNLVCHKAMLCAWAAGEMRVRRAHARRAIADSECLPRWQRIPLVGRLSSPARDAALAGEGSIWRGDP